MDGYWSKRGGEVGGRYTSTCIVQRRPNFGGSGDNQDCGAEACLYYLDWQRISAICEVDAGKRIACDVDQGDDRWSAQAARSEWRKRVSSRWGSRVSRCKYMGGGRHAFAT